MKNRITIPNFYDDVEIISEDERKEMAKAPFNIEDYKELNIDVYGKRVFNYGKKFNQTN